MNFNKPIIQVFILFLAINAIVFMGHNILRNWDIKPPFLVIVNCMLFFMFIVTHFRNKKRIDASPHVLVQNVMLGTIFKLIVFGGAALTYASKKNVTPIGTTTLLVAMAMYIAYAYFEVKMALKK